jgi:hypothetical protein
MESHGKAGLIQVSQATATLIQDAGKGQWLRKREDKIKAKGKGQLETYWVNPSNRLREGARSSTRSVMSTNVSAISEQEAAQRERLVNWNVDLLSRLIKSIVLQRNSSPSLRKNLNKRGNSRVDLMSREDSKRSMSAVSENDSDVDSDNKKPRDEIAEVIKLPRSKTSFGSSQDDPDSIELDETVMHQLTELIRAICSLYHKNHFHGFEHACNVTMSARKFLCRVVSTDNDDHGRSYTAGINSDPLSKYIAYQHRILFQFYSSVVSYYSLCLYLTSIFQLNLQLFSQH